MLTLSNFTICSWCSSKATAKIAPSVLGWNTSTSVCTRKVGTSWRNKSEKIKEQIGISRKVWQEWRLQEGTFSDFREHYATNVYLGESCGRIISITQQKRDSTTEYVSTEHDGRLCEWRENITHTMTCFAIPSLTKPGAIFYFVTLWLRLMIPGISKNKLKNNWREKNTVLFNRDRDL